MSNKTQNAAPRAGSSRRSFLKGAGLLAAGMVHGEAQKPASRKADAENRAKPNVLWLMSDDMCAELSCYGALARAQTPNLDRLASEGVRFDRNYCQFPLCNPSRASLLTGRRPATTGVLGNRTDFRAEHPDWVSLPQFFREHGYETYRTGKIFHGGIDDPKAWDTVGFDENKVSGIEPSIDHKIVVPPQQVPAPPSYDWVAKPVRPGQTERNHGAHSDQMLIVDGDGSGHPENHSAELAMRFMEAHANAGTGDRKPFFLACGFSKPHSPPEAPQRFYDLYKLKDLELPPNFAAWPTVPPDLPSAAIRKINADLFIGRGASEYEAKLVLRAYLASAAWMDWNVGRVLQKLDTLGLANTTIVVFIADHGYQLGERGKWSKAGSLFEMGARVPLIVRAPGVSGNGRPCYKTVQSLDLYPTMLELCGFSRSEGLEGTSLVPLLEDSNAEWNRPAFSIWSEDGKTVHGTSVRTGRYRYAEFGANASNGAMLFDEHVDPYELVNLADDPKHDSVRAAHSQLIVRYNTGEIA